MRFLCDVIDMAFPFAVVLYYKSKMFVVSVLVLEEERETVLQQLEKIEIGSGKKNMNGINHGTNFEHSTLKEWHSCNA